MEFQIFKNRLCINTICADSEDFVKSYCSKHGYDYKIYSRPIGSDYVSISENANKDIQARIAELEQRLLFLESNNE